MEKKQYELCIEILRRLNKTGVLKNIVLIGSWCIPFYKGYFSETRYASSMRTRDIDLLVPFPSKFRTKVDVPELLKDLGFVVSFKGTKGYIKLEHPELIVEFLVPEKGKGLDKPYALPKLGLNAQTLRFLNFLARHTINVTVEGMRITLPHPATFALHKLIISQRRRNVDKADKDRSTAISILRALINKGESGAIKDAFNSTFQKSQRKIKRELHKAGEEKVLKILD